MLTKLRKLSKIKNYKTLIMCEKCYSFYYKNSWHFRKPKYLSEDIENEIPVHFTECSACLEQENALYDREQSYILGSQDKEFGNMVF